MELHRHTTCWPDEEKSCGPAPAVRERKRGPNRKTRPARSVQSNVNYLYLKCCRE